ncbi:MAG TPA: macro domain-containing protein [Acidimicrobiales bacterium]|nr:macro domain-containing protein [Acidimicrobiales bacterium]
MITDTDGDLLDDDADALVNPVNLVGVMVQGLALAVKRRHPDMFKDYERAARRGELDLGRMHVWATGGTAPRLVVNFPTRRHWRSKVRPADIEAGLDDLVRVVAEHGITSLAVPALGCGSGGLAWSEVRPLLERALAAVPEVDVRLYGPGGRPGRDAGTGEARRVPMTPARAALVTLVDRYAAVAPEVTMMEVQKLLYFLQEAGHDLRLTYVRDRHGPDAEDLRHALVPLEGSLVAGYGDGSEPAASAGPIEVLPGAVDDAAAVVATVPGLAARIERVLALARGYESPYGLELLATVHWVATRDDPAAADDPQRAVALVGSSRPGRMFTEAHVASASGHLAARGWFGPRPLVPASAPA